MPAADTARKVTRTAKKSTTKVAATAKGSARSTADAAKESAAKVAKTTKRAVGGARATRAAKAGMVEDARQVAADAGAQSSAADAIAEAEAMHYQVEVNKRGLSVKTLTKTLNARWDNGWRLAHMLEQRGNTVLVFEKRT
ncbi:MAG TPA: hypothetical protein VHF24_04570 [Acidimicrobiales bacterium]|jgi:hypothetical protein|nr:hypothetical protein [Acidimicrobiales bacterium]